MLFILNCPLPSYPKRRVFNIDGNPTDSIDFSKSFSVSMLAYGATIRSKFVRNSFSVNLSWLIFREFLAGKTLQKASTVSSASVGIFSNSKVITSTDFANFSNASLSLYAAVVSKSET